MIWASWEELNKGRRSVPLSGGANWEKGERRKLGDKCGEVGRWNAVDDAKHARLFRRHLYIAAEDPACLRCWI